MKIANVYCFLTEIPSHHSPNMSNGGTAQSMKAVSLKFGQPNSATAPTPPPVPPGTDKSEDVVVEFQAAAHNSTETAERSSLSVTEPVALGARILSELIDLSDVERFSDLQIQTDRLIYANAGGSTRPMTKWGKLSSPVAFSILRYLYESRRVFLGIGPEKGEVDLEELFLAERKLDFASEGSGPGSPLKNGRFRVQAHFSNRGIGMTIRVLRNTIASLEQIGMPAEVIESLRQRVGKKQGMGLIVGPTGSGKTTTLAALLDWVRRSQNKHIVTIEDPIEYVYPDTVEAGGSVPPLPAPALVTQQEVGAHVRSFEQGLVDSLRKKPDIILVGEIRTAETLRIALEAAETGHFILSTLHTRGAGKTLGRMRQMFSLEQARGILQQFADVGSFILSQGLMPDVTGRYVLCCEYFAIQEIEDRNAIRKYAEGGFQDVEERLNKPYNRKWNSELKALLNTKRITPEVYEQFYQVTGLENK
jgi:twitching motility protein PilT